MLVTYPNDAVHIFINELTSRVVAESRFPTDRFHLGKLILQSLKDAPDFVSQIDGATDESETNGSVLERSIRCALSLRNMGLKTGDVMVLMAPNHLHLAIPFFAALYLGLGIAGQDRTFGVKELKPSFKYLKPKVVFCQSEKADDVQQILNELNLESVIITFDNKNGFRSFEEFLGNNGNIDVNDFKASDFDTEVTNAFLISTSGTTGAPKSAAVTHKQFALGVPYWWSHFKQFPAPTRMKLSCSSIVWLSGYLSIFTCALFKVTRLQTSRASSTDHVTTIIKKYKPTHTLISSTFVSSLIHSSEEYNLDLSSFTSFHMGGSAVTPDLIANVKAQAPNAAVLALYGMTEIEIGLLGSSFPKGTLGQQIGCLQYRLVDIETQKDVIEPNVPGELWVKGPSVIKEYYNNREATTEAFSNDGWFKTGDIFYRDEYSYYYFVERMKMLLKYKSYHISPVELEIIIRGHKGVLDVVVTSVPDEECGDLAVACVIRSNKCAVTAQEIKELVKNNLSETKQLRGGVVFVEEFPLTASIKVNRQKVKELVMNMTRE